MKRVLFLFSHPAPYKVNLFNGLASFLDLTVVFERQLGSYSRQQYLPNDQMKFKYFFLKGLKIGQENHLSWGLVHHLKKHPYDVIVINGYSSLTEILTILYLQKHRIPYYIYVNGGVIREAKGFKFRFKKRLIAHAAGFFSPTPLVDDYLINYGAKPSLIHHYPYSTMFANELVNAPLSKDEKQALRKTIGLPLDGQICLSIGQFIPRKNFASLIRAWRHVAPSIHLIIVGDGPQRAYYQRLIKRLKLNHVILKPFQPKNLLLSMLRASDGFILLSKEDIYGHVVNEALSQGVPVLTSDQVISGKVLIQPNQTGVIMPLHQLDRLPDYLGQLLRNMNPEKCLEVARQYTIETMVKTHHDLFDQLGKHHG